MIMIECLHCQKTLPYDVLHSAFVAHDYSTSFIFECPHCNKLLTITVEAIPEFSVEKKKKKGDYGVLRKNRPT